LLLALPGAGHAERRTGHIALLPGGPLFLQPQRDAVARVAGITSEQLKSEGRISQLEQQLEEYGQIRERLREENKSLRDTVRDLEGAKAWRCAIQLNSPSARRLHWWALDGGAVEFASAAVHDDMSIPE